MRIVIDLQAAQSTGSRNRGIGRYSLSLAQAMARNCGQHELLIVLSGLFPETVQPIKDAFTGLLPPENIHVWSAAAPTAEIDGQNRWRMDAAELIREAFIANLKPDVVHVASLFEGLMDDAITSIGRLPSVCPVAVTLYDLIPLINKKPYLDNPLVESWYYRKLDFLRQADLLLSISESSRQEALEHLGFPADRVHNISTDADDHFNCQPVAPQTESEVRGKYGLGWPFVMYTGGIDHRKNIEGLIRAYARLPGAVRSEHQLAIVCSAHPESRMQLEQLARSQGLEAQEVVFTGFVPEEDLISLYRLCKLFVFPSWHEGFGLPALEAMRCGAAVIAANTSSLPEVIGLDAALFDPRSDEAIASAMLRGLTDEGYRQQLIEHGKIQSGKFSWDESARRAIERMEASHISRKANSSSSAPPTARPRLAYISPLPPERSGISDYSAELLPVLSEHYDIDVIVAQDAIADDWINSNCDRHDVDWFRRNASQFDRVLYHFGNSHFHQHMFPLLESHPGVVVLHDFFLSGVIHQMDALGITPGSWRRELYHSHGYPALAELYLSEDVSSSIWKYPANLSVLQGANGLIVHSANSLRLAQQWYGPQNADLFAVIPLMRAPRLPISREQARAALGIDEKSFVVCSFGLLGPHKLNHRLIEAWNASALAGAPDTVLVFVGESPGGQYEQVVNDLIQAGGAKRQIKITGWADTELFKHYLAAADVGVQLRALSRGETSAAVMDCMNYGLATIINANGSMADIADEAVWKLEDEFSNADLVTALETLWRDADARRTLAGNAMQVIADEHAPDKCAAQYRTAIEGFYQQAAHGVNALTRAIACSWPQQEESHLLRLANSMARSFQPSVAPRQVLVDVSVLVQTDAKSGIQRVVRAILREWLSSPLEGVRIEPVYAAADGYRYAREFTLRFLSCPEAGFGDEPIDFAKGDVFIGLDLNPHGVVAHRNFYQELRMHGVAVHFVIYDLLPVLMPEAFEPGTQDVHANWLKAISEADGAVCISRSVADELKQWVETQVPEAARRLRIRWFHLGADLLSASSRQEVTDVGSEAVLQAIGRAPSFLMVGTIEPRKGHAQVLGAFEELWRAGQNVNLVIIGKQGWLVDNLIQRIHVHPESGKRLFWLADASDSLLEELYNRSTCLIAASKGEGFGLPLIEAAHHRLPIIARDLPVFREIANDHAFYFSGADAQSLASFVDKWLDLYDKSEHPQSVGLKHLSWGESATELIGVLLGSNIAK